MVVTGISRILPAWVLQKYGRIVLNFSLERPNKPPRFDRSAL
jgi:hypothetical protein